MAETPEKMSNPVLLLKLLADETRLNILRQLFVADAYVELIASRLSLTPATVCYHLKKLEGAGLVRCSRTQFYMIYALNRDIFDRTLKEVIGLSPAPLSEDEAYNQNVLRTFLVNGRLTRIPSQQKKQAIVLRAIAEHFELGTDYSESQVNAILIELYDDVCTLRRTLIEHKLLSRSHEVGQRDIYRRGE